jgi:hypothetical protein
LPIGKTLTVLSYLQLIVEERETRLREQEIENGDDEDDDLSDEKSKKKYGKHKLKRRYLKTLVIVPASLLHHW